jgi:hypothetical protein
MTTKTAATLAIGAMLLAPTATHLAAQHAHDHPAPADTAAQAQPRRANHPAVPTAPAPASMDTTPRASGRMSAPGEKHEMLMARLGRGWTVAGMAQAFPIATAGAPFDDDSPLNDGEAYLTQPAVMVNVSGPGSRLVLRTTLNLEAETQRGGEYAFGGWGEGYADKRHPHTFVHEAMLSLNAWDAPGGAFSLSAGKGFAPYGTDDPMSRPAVKYPTNHHLSQVLERWTVNAVYLHRSGLSVEAGLFGGGEPAGPSDLDNAKSFGDSWSARVTQRLGGGFGPFAPWEISASYARVEEAHHGAKEVTHLLNAALRHERAYRIGTAYALLEASRSEPKGAAEGYWAVLGETRLGLGRGARHRPYYRVEYSTRPEYERAGAPGTDDFYRYDHGAHAIGATRWLIQTAGYGYDLTGAPLSLRPFVEVQHNRVWSERGDVDPVALFGKDRFWSASVGVRVFLGGGPMRMGSYGVLDPMSAAMRPNAEAHGAAAHDRHGAEHGNAARDR